MLKERKAYIAREANLPLICDFLHYLARLEHAMDCNELFMICCG